MVTRLDGHRSINSRKIIHVLAAALLLTLLNAIKPLHVDDNFFYYYAAQVAEHPEAPYDFEVPWNQVPEPAHNPFAPLVVPYWLAMAIKLFGQNVFLWKLWFLPINALFVWSLFTIFRRFASGLEVPLTWMTVFSPVILPSVNLMLDVPVQAFGLFALVTFFRACDRRSTGLAVLSGLSCSLAMGTKWTGFLALAAICTYSVLYFRPKQGLIAATLAVALFAGWEGYIAWQSGKSHFLFQVLHNKPSDGDRQIKLPLIMIIGGLAPAVALLGMAGLGLARRWVLTAAGLFVAGLALVAINPPMDSILGSMHNPMTGKMQVPKVATPIFMATGLAAWAITALVAWRLWGRRVRHLLRRTRRADMFLVAWLVIEVAGYFVFSPFPAARRVVGVFLVMTVLAGRLASRTCRTPRKTSLVRFAAGFSVALGALFYWVDLREAKAEKRAVTEAAAWVREQGTGGDIYFNNFEYDARRLGLRPMEPDRSHAKAGDWLIVKIRSADEHLVYPMAEEDVQLVRTVGVGDGFPLTTVPWFYIGSRPIDHHEGPRVRALIFRLARDFNPTRVGGGKLWDTKPIPFGPARWTDSDATTAKP